MKINEQANIVFMGSSEFGLPILNALNNEFGIKCVVTLPDKPQGRGLKLIPTPIKKRALELNIPVLQPEKLKDEEFITQLKSYEPDIICVIAFRILPKIVYEIPSIGTFNIHPSLLPKYRGAAPLNWTILNGDSETAITSFLLQDKLDAGDIILQKKYNIPDGWTAGDLYDFMSKESVSFGIDTCKKLLAGDFVPLKQDDTQATPAPKLFAENSEINWKQDSRTIRNFIHGHSPNPGAWTLFQGKRLKIYRVEYSESGKGEAGTYIIDKNKFHVHCKTGTISLLEFQLPDKKAVTFKQFINGYRGKKVGKMGNNNELE